MKKLLRVFVILLCVFSCGLALTSCGERKVDSISISISEQYASLASGTRTYAVAYSAEKIPLVVSINPSNYTTQDLVWRSSATDVAYISNDGKLVTVGEGLATITARFDNSNGTSTYGSLKIYVTREALPKFAQDTYQVTYQARDLKNEDYAIPNNADETKYSFIYYYETTSGLREVNELKDAGNYIIKYYLIGDREVVVDEMALSITKAQLTLDAPNLSTYYLESAYADGRETKFYPSNNVPRYDYELRSTIGDDNNVVVGNYSYTTTAKTDSKVGSLYSTNVEVKLLDSYANNYYVVTHSGRHTIRPQEIFIVLSDQTITYGDSLSANDFKVYDYSDFEETDYSRLTALSLETMLAKNDIRTDGYDVTLDGNPALVNRYGNYDVLEEGSYSLSYSNAGIHTSSNITLKAVVGAELFVSKRDIEITPVDTSGHNFTRYYSQAEDLSQIMFNINSSIKFMDEINSLRSQNDFIFVDYERQGQRADEDKYGQNYVKMDPGTYYFRLDEEIAGNKNFNLSLCTRAQKDYNGDGKIVYNVLAAEVVVLFNSLETIYNKTLGADIKVSYFDNGESDYILSIGSLKINDTYIYQNSLFVENNGVCSACGQDGFFTILSTGDQLAFDLTASNLQDSVLGNHYKGYSIGWELNPVKINRNGFDMPAQTFVDTKLWLNKIPVVVRPSTGADSSVMYKVESQTQSVEDFLNNVVVVSPSNINIDDIIKAPTGLGDKRNVFVLKQDANSNYVTASGELRSQISNVDSYVVTRATGDPAYVDGMQCYELIMDTSRVYTFDIVPCDAYIEANDYDESMGINTKEYGTADSKEVIYFTAYKDEYKSAIINVAAYSGSMVRESGENVGEYAITGLGTLSLGPNYRLIFLDSDAKYYISPRDLYVRAYDTMIRYGQQFPTRATSYGDFVIDKDRVEEYDPNILVWPTVDQFAGEFKLSADNTYNATQKINGLYKAGSYHIVFGDEAEGGFRYVGFTDNNGNIVKNYTLKQYPSVDDLPVCVIQQANLVVDIISQNVDSLPQDIDNDSGSSTYHQFSWNLSSGRFIATGLVDSNESVLFNCHYTIDDGNAAVFVGSSDSRSITVTRNGTDVTSCYNCRLNNSTIYLINSEMIELKFVPKSTLDTTKYTIDTDGNIITYTYDGQSYEQLFDIQLVGNKGSKFKFDLDTETFLYNNSTSEAGLVWTKTDYANATTTPFTEPTDAGVYSLDIKLPEGYALQLLKCDDSGNPIDNTTYVFTDFRTRDRNCFLELTQPGYLTINKADITVDISKLAFEDSFIYGRDQSALPNLNAGSAVDIIFSGVDGNTITLLDTTSTMADGTEYTLNYQFVSANNALNTLDAGSPEEILITIQKALNGDPTTPDINYNPLSIRVQLNIAPRNIYLNSSNFKFSRSGVEYAQGGAGSLEYNGGAVTWWVEPEVVISNIVYDEQNESQTLIEIDGKYYEQTDAYTIKDSVCVLDTEFDGEECKIKCRTLEVGGNISETYELHTLDELLGILGNDIIYKDADKSCIRFGDSYVYFSETSGRIINAGVYLCEAHLYAKDNYRLVDRDNNSTSQWWVDIVKINRSLGANFMFEVENETFYAGTRIDYTNPSEIIRTFGITMAPNYASKLKFLGESTWADQDYILPVNDAGYTITAQIDDVNDRDVMNYYYSKQIHFNIIKCEATINFPSTENYVYNASSIDGFIRSITITQKDINGGKTTITYSQASSSGWITVQTFQKYNLGEWEDYVGTEQYPCPKDPGKYVLKLKFVNNSYESELSSYYYNIIPRDYDGEVSAYNTVLNYEPLEDYAYIYDKIIGNLKIDKKPVSQSSIVESVTIYLAKIQDAEEEASYGSNIDSIIIPSYDGLTQEQKQRLVGMIMQVKTDGANVIAQPLTYKIVFTGDTLSDKYLYTPTLTINKNKITASSFEFNGDQSLVYCGEPIFHGLIYGGVDMSPYAPEEQEIGSSVFQVETEYDSANNLYTVSIVDGLGNNVVEVIYSYTLLSNSSPVPRPIEPNTYRVSVSMTAGNNYSMKIDGQDTYTDSKVFVIYKATSIQVSISQAINGLVYTGEDLTNAIFALANISAQASLDGSTAHPSVKLTVVNKGKDTGVASYSVEKGIMIYASIYKDDANSPLAQVVDAGTYHLKVYYPAGISGYNISNYTNSLTFNSKAEEIIDFTIDKQSFTIDLATLYGAWEITSGETSTEDNILQASTTTRIGILDIINYNGVKLYKVSDDYAICVTVNSNGLEGAAITDFDDYGFASSMFGSSDKAYIFVYRISDNDLNNYERSQGLVVRIVVIPEPEPEPEPEP